MNERSLTTACSSCGAEKAADHFRQCASCRARHAGYMRSYRAKRPNLVAYHREWLRRRRETVLAHYGGSCACCGESEFGFLALDHIGGGGGQHRAEVGQGSRMVDWIIREGFPDGFRVLCHNCNQAMGYYGECPHAVGVRAVLEVA